MPERVVVQMLLIIGDGLADVGFIQMHVEMVEPEPRHLLAQLIRRIEIAQQAAGCGLSAQLVEGLLKRLLQRLLLLRIRNLVGVTLLRSERPRDLGQRTGRDWQAIDDGLGRCRQSILRARMELPIEPAVAAQPRELGDD